MSGHPDLGPTAARMADLLEGIGDEQLTAPTPCPAYTLGDLIEHVGGLAQAFTMAAIKEFPDGGTQPPSPDASRLGDDWRTRIPRQLATLAGSWRNPDAWEGMTQAGGVEMPADVMGRVALNELVIHGWDVARASGQPYEVDAEALDASMDFVSAMSAPGQEASRQGLFGPVVPVATDAPLLDRVIGLSGRDPRWGAAAAT